MWLLCLGWLLTWLAVSLLLYCLAVRRGWHSNPSTPHPARTLFVTAHPDDEAMFFAPTILALTERHPQSVYLLCLSCGDYNKQGRRRAAELWASAAELGIPPENVTLVQSWYFQDNPAASWDQTRLAHAISYHVDSLDIAVVVSFDEYGVSGHENHRALADALHRLQVCCACRVFFLDSVNVVRKYMSVLDVAATLLTGLLVQIAGPSRRARALRAMAAHASQMVWFRHLYVVFSRYMVLNSFTELTDELSLQL